MPYFSQSDRPGPGETEDLYRGRHVLHHADAADTQKVRQLLPFMARSGPASLRAPRRP